MDRAAVDVKEAGVSVESKPPGAMKTITVECTFRIPILVPAEWDDDQVRFHVEDNGCPGTKEVGAALEKFMRECESQCVCWACRLQGVNKVVKEIA